jgi:hypothetical protein
MSALLFLLAPRRRARTAAPAVVAPPRFEVSRLPLSPDRPVAVRPPRTPAPPLQRRLRFSDAWPRATRLPVVPVAD